jgi:hypothetical protein
MSEPYRGVQTPVAQEILLQIAWQDIGQLTDIEPIAVTLARSVSASPEAKRPAILPMAPLVRRPMWG